MGQLPVTVTGCGDWVAFSTEGGCAAAAATSVSLSAPTDMRLQTYYLAAWRDVAAGGVPRDVRAKVCRCAGGDEGDGGDGADETGEDEGGNSNCETRAEEWRVVEATRTVARVKTILYTGVINGVSAVSTEWLRPLRR